MSRKERGRSAAGGGETTGRRGRAEPDEPLLFDLPLVPPERSRPARTSPAAAGAAAEPLQPPLFAEPEPEEYAAGDAAVELGGTPAPAFAPETPSGPFPAGVGARFLAGCADLLVHAGVLAGVYLGLVALEIEPRVSHWPALATLLVAFSFLSSVVSLAFWGQTAGMAWRGLQSRDRLQRPLTFRQAMLRWVGGLLTLGAAGLPLLLALRGTSLADWLSRSVTYATQGHLDPTNGHLAR